MFLRQIWGFPFVGVLMILFVNSLPQDSDDSFDSIALYPDCDPDSNNRPIEERDTTGFPNDSTNQGATGSSNDLLNKDFNLASNDFDPLGPVDEIAPEHPSPDMSNPTPTTDKTLLADDGMDLDAVPAWQIGWCPDDKKLACCHSPSHSSWQWNGESWEQVKRCYWRGPPDVLHCDAWLCCGPKHDDPNPYNRKNPDPETCEDPRKGPRPLPPGPTHVPTDIPQSPEGVRKNPPSDQEPADQRPMCLPRHAPQGF